MGRHHHQHGHHNDSYGYAAAPPYPPLAAPIVPYAGSQPWGYAPPAPFPGAESGNYGPPIPYGYNPPAAGYQHQGVVYQQQEQFNHALADAHRHKRNEHMGEMGAAAAGAFAMYERHEAKVDPAHARRHKVEAEVAGALALGSAGYALHEHHEKKKSEHRVELVGGENKHGRHHHKKHHHF